MIIPPSLRLHQGFLKGSLSFILAGLSLMSYGADNNESTLILTADSLPLTYQTDELRGIPMPDSDVWWTSFNDLSLSSLINTAVANNYNLRAAMKRIEASRQMLRGVYSGYYPTLGVYTGLDFNKDSDREKIPYVKENDNSSFNLGATMSWEIDIFGRVAAQARGSKAALKVSRLEYEAMMLSIAAEVATDYSEFRMYQRQLNMARVHLSSQTEMLRIVEARYDAGLVSKLDVAQARNTLNSTRLMIPGLEANIVTMRNALATLCGVNEDSLRSMIDDNTYPEAIPPIGIGVPADLVRRRPDVVEAEQQIEQLSAQLGVAKKDWLPTLTVNATAETSAHAFGDLFGFRSLHYSVEPQLSWTLFNGFSRQANIAEAKAELEAQIDSYNMTLLTAVQEVNNSIASYEAALREVELYKEVIKDSQEVLKLATERYKLGLTDFSDVATAQISLLSQQTSYESAAANCFNSVVDLYKALGGGWSY